MTTGDDVRPTARRREQLTELARRSKEVILLSALVGTITGFAVAAFDTVVVRSLARIDRAPLVVGLVGALVGLTLAALALRFIGARATPSTADEYIRGYHDPTVRLDGRSLVGRMVAAVATLGSGCPMGLEGPSLYAGARAWIRDGSSDRARRLGDRERRGPGGVRRGRSQQ